MVLRLPGPSGFPLVGPNRPRHQDLIARAVRLASSGTCMSADRSVDASSYGEPIAGLAMAARDSNRFLSVEAAAPDG
jgi:hypothetical protein